MTLEDLRLSMTVRAWNVLYTHMQGNTTAILALDTDAAALLGLAGAGPAVVRQIQQGIAAYEWHTYSHPLCTEP